MINGLQIQDTNVERILAEIIERIEHDDIQFKAMPIASKSYKLRIVQYVGETDSNYTNGFFYKCTETPVYETSVSFEPASVSGTVVACDPDDFVALVNQYGQDVENIVGGTLTYVSNADLWRLVAKDSENSTVCTFQLYTPDYEDAGFIFTGTPADDDVVDFVFSMTQTGNTYSWNRINVQPTE